MAVDKLVDSSQLNSDLTSVANAIRTKGGTAAQLAFPADFITAINAISGGGGYAAADWLDVTKPTGALASNFEFTSSANADNTKYNYLLMHRTGITSVSLPNALGLATSMFQGCTGLTSVYIPKVTAVRDNCFYGCTSLEYAVFPSASFGFSSTFYGCTSLLGADFIGNMGATYTFRNCSKLKYLVLRKTDAVQSMNSTNDVQGTPFASGGTGGTVYCPADMISSYQSASNWSTILGYANNQIKSIESTHTDPDAPVDLTLYYINGSTIPTT